MFIYNVSLRKIKFLKILIFTILALLLITFMVFIYNKFQSNNKVYVTDTSYCEEVYDLPDSNYTNMLKDCYEHLDSYVGKKIKCSGFIHKLYDFKDNQFVLGREMLTSPISNDKAEVVVVGFLCETENTSSFDEKTWVEIEGEITEGFYHSKIPVIKVTKIKKIECPDMPLVNPPDGGYVTQQST